ncbi:ORF6N domain-containing protein [Anaerococcus porci]|uniref:ORF6N domain-containing protein n=1 Tax=Anaerococcus porci TaxID=2652269 RepID=UPI002A761D16|nr:ORF6N domain-containing protein [Anaerococcus porci]MDY3006018.1 ORF6N domain-containing protein [Anaerococcus porci]
MTNEQQNCSIIIYLFIVISSMKGQKMNDLVKINNQNVERKIFNNQPVITFKDIDKVHERPQDTASRNFRKNKKHFIENIDYFILKPEKYKNDEIRRFGINSPRGGYLFTESGYLMLVKSFYLMFNYFLD